MSVLQSSMPRGWSHLELTMMMNGALFFQLGTMEQAVTAGLCKLYSLVVWS